MTERIQAILKSCLAKEHHSLRRVFPAGEAYGWQNGCMNPEKRAAARFCALLAEETPVVPAGRRLLLQRTVTDVPGIFSAEETEKLRAGHFLHELGYLSNVCPDYSSVIAVGLDAVQAAAEKRLARCRAECDPVGADFLEAALAEIRAVEDLCGRYRAAALAAGCTEAVALLEQVPHGPARSFAECLEFFRILHFSVWAEGEYHMTVGRFDQFAWPYLKQDLSSGALTQEQALELLEEFFITFNLDSDLYPGVQQGDDGQSLMLGGVDAEGRDAFNPLSSLCLTAARELKLIDPKINLRVDKNTPQERFLEGTRLTKEGLGFPQYSNDDVVVPALEAWGYSTEDARNYTVAACWEFIIPGRGMDINNIGGLSFPKCVNAAMNARLADCADYDSFRKAVSQEIAAECGRICGKIRNLYIFPAPFLSLMMEGAVENARDWSLGGKYNNFGIHGTGVATAADSLAAIRQTVFEEHSVSAREMIGAVAADFKGYEKLRQRLRTQMPKMGNDDDRADGEAAFLLGAFAEALRGRKNERGGIFRPGTGTAMFYLQHARETPCTPDGRSGGEPFGANFSPSLFVKTAGPVSIVRSFTKADLRPVCNGGPLTMEFHSSLFRDAESMEKVAQLVRYFILRGGHQFQLNAVSLADMKDAQVHPEKHSRLVVRVWGWSAYFVELDRGYQDHVIARQEYDA